MSESGSQSESVPDRWRIAPKASLREIVGWGLLAQVSWALLSALWNVVGVTLVTHGAHALGPTPSISAAAALLAIAATCVETIGRAPVVYMVVSIAAGLLALAAVVNAFTADPSLWPSEFWRYAGTALNAVGVLAAFAAMVAWAKWRGNS